MPVAEVLLYLSILGGYAVFVWWLWRADSSWPRRASADRLRAQRRHPAASPALRESVLFVCTHNFARSQMAEALLRQAARNRFHVASAGTAPTNVHPLAEQVMAEHGLSLHSHRAKPIDEMGTRWDYVITVCDAAYEQCPEFPPKTGRLHWSVEDPSRATGTPAQQLEAFRRVRDELAARIRQWVADRPERP
jgi:arsenate reductase (thioredoxin)